MRSCCNEFKLVKVQFVTVRIVLQPKTTPVAKAVSPFLLVNSCKGCFLGNLPVARRNHYLTLEETSTNRATLVALVTKEAYPGPCDPCHQSALGCCGSTHARGRCGDTQTPTNQIHSSLRAKTRPKATTVCTVRAHAQREVVRETVVTMTTGQTSCQRLRQTDLV